MKEYDPETGCPKRRVDLSTIADTSKIPGFGKPKGSDLFNRVN